MASFADRVKKLRTDRGLTKAQLAKAMHLDPSAVSRWELGENYAPQSMVISLANYFGVSTDYLLGRTDDPRPFPVEDTRTIDEKIKDEDFTYALYEGAKNLSEDEKQELLDLFELIKIKHERKNKGE